MVQKSRKAVISLLLSIVMILAVVVPAFAASPKPVVDYKPYENSEFFEVGDYSIHYRQFKAKNPKGQIFMIHGFALSSYCWVELATRLQAKGYTCVLVDQPDFGYSTRETKETNIMDREDICYALMKKLSSKPWYVAGHSMGGYIALGVAQKYPGIVKDLLLYNTGGYDGATGLRAALMASDTYMRIAGPVLQTAATIDPIILFAYSIACMDPIYAWNYDRAQIENPYRIAGTGEGALRNFSYMPKTDYAKIKKANPILYVNGSLDFVFNAQLQQSLRDALPKGSTDVTVPGGGHMTIETHADQCAKITLKFLKAHK
ncbi:MAG: alpha/beta hydrolase [Clostridia bacterium]|nr:alpha/beta hydrolase [Clostridia bacterium]